MADDRGTSLGPQGTIFARICLERGLATRAQIAECLLNGCSPKEGGGGDSLPAMLIARGVLTMDQAERILADVSSVARSGAYAEVRKDDASIGQLLVESRAVVPGHVEEALRIQNQRAKSGAPVPRLGEILLEKGQVTLAALQEALQQQKCLLRLSCPGCGSRYAVDDPGTAKVYLCRRCASPLSPATAEQSQTPEAPEPEEVRRSATNPKNVVGKYVAVRELGRGSMGAVYKAWDRGVKRWVALKVLLGATSPELLIRFRREAETAASLQHPSIVPIYDVGHADDRHFIAMRYVEGETLVGKTFPPRAACELMVQAARAVGHAHRRDIVHRDLKPGNIMVDSSGRAFVLDFGLAKDLFGSFQLTAPGTIMGTPNYMPPEQAAGRTHLVNQRSDVYSLGAILYELLTARPPFSGDRAIEIIRKVTSQEPVLPPSRIRPEIPADLERIVMRSLEKERLRRYEFADGLADDLEACLVGRPTSVKPAPETKPSVSKLRPRKTAARTQMWWILLILLATAMILGLFLGLG